LYGILQYGEETQPDEKGIEPHKPDLMKYLPSYYEKSEIMKAIQDAYSTEFGYIYFFLKIS